MKNEPLEQYKVELKELDLDSPSAFKKIGCPSCEADVPAENININDKIAKCGNCHVVFPFHDEVADLMDSKKAKQEVIRPEGIDMFYYRNELDITIQQPLLVAEGMIAGFVPVFAALFIAIYFIKGTIPLAFPLVTSLISIASWINLFARRNHKVHISMDDRHLSIIRRPKKFIKDQHYRINDIDQIYVKGPAGMTSVYMIVNSAMGQKHVKLISSVDSLSKARFIEQEIERHLSIPDRRIPEENP
jgi:hypothetical protein